MGISALKQGIKYSLCQNLTKSTVTISKKFIELVNLILATKHHRHCIIPGYCAAAKHELKQDSSINFISYNEVLTKSTDLFL